MSEIDWSKAPEGATHCNPESSQASWYRRNEGQWEYYSSPVFAWMLSNNSAPFFDRLKVRPTAWRGPEDGLPPVGAEVEAWIENRKVWAKVTVLAVDVDTVVWRNGTDRRSYIGTHVNDLRPLKSDKERAVEAALAQDCDPRDGMLSRHDFCARLYDAGLLRLPEEQS